MSEFNPNDFFRAHRPPLIESQEAAGLLFPKFKLWRESFKMSMPPVVYVDYFETDDPDYPLLVDLYLFYPYDKSPVFTHQYICSMIPREFLFFYHDCRKMFSRVHFVVDFNNGDLDVLNSVPEPVDNKDLFREQ